MSTQAIQAGEAFVALNIKQDEFNKSIIQVSSKLDDLGKKTKSLTNLVNSALNGAAKSWKPLGDIISLTGISVDLLGTSLFSLCSHLTKATYAGQLLRFSKLQEIVATKLETAAIEKTIIVKYGYIAASYAAAAAMKVLGAAQSLLNAVMLGCPLVWFIGGIAALGIVVGAAKNFFGAFNNKLADHAKAMEEARKKNESYLTSARSSLATLQELSNIDPWQSDKKSVNLSAWNDLQRTTKKLGISLEELGVKFDANTGKIDASEQAIAKLKEAMRVKELNDLNAAIEAQEEHLDDLHSKLDKNGKVGLGRWIGTYVTLGYMDNAEEIQKKIDEASQSLQENQEKRKVLVDFSAEYKENEAKL